MGFQEAEKRRRSIIGSMIETQVNTEETIKGQMDIDNNFPEYGPGKGRPKATRETKKRVSMAFLPSIYDDISKIAYIDRVSISELTARLMEEHISKNQDKIKEYDD